MCVTTSRKRSSDERVGVPGPIILLFRLKVAQNNEGFLRELARICITPRYRRRKIGIALICPVLFPILWPKTPPPRATYGFENRFGRRPTRYRSARDQHTVANGRHPAPEVRRAGRCWRVGTLVGREIALDGFRLLAFDRAVRRQAGITNLIEERAIADAQRARGLLAVPVVRLQGLEDDFPL